MQKGVLIFDGDIAIEKRVYSGDTEDLVSALTKEGVTYKIMDDEDPAFIDAVILLPKSPSQIGWDQAKSQPVDKQIIYLASLLGLK